MDIKDKTALVTGGGGFMGSHLCAALIRAGVRVRVLDNLSSGRSGNLADIMDSLDFIQGCVTEQAKIGEACRGVDFVIHTAFPMVARERSMDTGMVVDFTAGLLNLLKESLANKALFVYTSSIAVYGNQKYVPIDESHPLEPVLLHGAMKLSGEYFCRTLAHSHGLKMVILRVADIYGPRNARISVPVRFLLNAMAGEPIKVHGDGRQQRTYTYVDDYVKAVLNVLKTPASRGQVMNISGSKPISMHELALLVKEITGSASPVIVQKEIATDERLLVIDNSLACQILALDGEVGIREGLTETWQWLRQNPDFYNRDCGN